MLSEVRSKAPILSLIFVLVCSVGMIAAQGAYEDVPGIPEGPVGEHIKGLLKAFDSDDPEVAWACPGEDACKEDGIDVVVGKHPYKFNSAAQIVGETELGYLATLEIPIRWVTRKIADVHERAELEAMYRELKATGKVERTLPADDRAVLDQGRLQSQPRGRQGRAGARESGPGDHDDRAVHRLRNRPLLRVEAVQQRLCLDGLVALDIDLGNAGPLHEQQHQHIAVPADANVVKVDGSEQAAGGSADHALLHHVSHPNRQGREHAARRDALQSLDAHILDDKVLCGH